MSTFHEKVLRNGMYPFGITGRKDTKLDNNVVKMNGAKIL